MATIEEEKYLTVKEFAAAANVTTQYIYKIINSSLKPYTKKQHKKMYINAAAVEYIKEGFPSVQPNQQEATNRPIEQPKPTETNQQQPTTTNTEKNKGTANKGEIEALKMLVAELKQDKEDLKRDKEDLKKEAMKWQQLLLEERNKVKLLEAAAEPKKEEIKEDIIIIKEPAAAAEPPKTEEAEPPQPKKKWYQFWK